MTKCLLAEDHTWRLAAFKDRFGMSRRARKGITDSKSWEKQQHDSRGWLEEYDSITPDGTKAPEHRVRAISFEKSTEAR